jgi:hypothetical protein
MYEALLVRKKMKKPNPSIPESFLALIRELNALGLEFSIRKFEGGFYSTTDFQETERDIFKDIEHRLKLRALLARKKVEQYSKPITLNEKLKNIENSKKGIKKKKKILLNDNKEF